MKKDKGPMRVDDQVICDWHSTKLYWGDDHDALSNVLRPIHENQDALMDDFLSSDTPVLVGCWVVAK